MFKVFILVLSVTTMFYQAAANSAPDLLEIEWKNNKVSIKAKEISTCEVLQELAEKTNTHIYNRNECDTPITLNIVNKPLNVAVEKILRHDSYALIDEGKERKLIVYKRENGQRDDSASYVYERAAPEVYIPDTTSYPDISQPYDSSQDTGATYSNDPGVGVAPGVDAGSMAIPESIQNPSEPPFNPEALEQGAVEGVPMPDPNEAYIDPSGAQAGSN